ncbi:pyruvate kinase-like, partial [Melanaphis sacchari]|uniref:pyruvate kinase-like n=1 Tax=Melanaphis sacchari TaxID=742174 RepID=UPI000DC13687
KNMFLNQFIKCIKPIYKHQNHLFQKMFHTNKKTLAWPPFVNDPKEKLLLNKKYLYGNDSNTTLEYKSSFNIDARTHSLRHSGIICTIGPASADVKVLEMLIGAGMNIARLNFSHGSHDYHLKTVENLRKASKNYSKKIGVNFPLAIALDTKGPEIRTGMLDGGNGATKEIKLKKGDKIRLSTDKQFEYSGSSKQVYVDYINITKIVKENDKIYVDDGLVLMTAIKIGENYIDCMVENGGMLGSRKGINLPGLAVDLPAVSEKDKADIQFAAEHDLDMIFASFIRDASAVNEIRHILGEQNKHILIVSKIENHQGIVNLPSIISVSDGIMVARGDLGIEIPQEKVFLAQKSILAQCNITGKPGICATQMLESMIKNPRPTRAESSDVANAIMDGADCVMLSGETAKGLFPVECVRTMDKLCREAESAIWQKEFFDSMILSVPYRMLDENQLMARTAVAMSDKYGAAAIIVIDPSSCIAHAIAMYRPRSIILAVTENHKVARQYHLHRGILPVLFSSEDDDCDTIISNYLEIRVKCALKLGKHLGILKSRDMVVSVEKKKLNLFCLL